MDNWTFDVKVNGQFGKKSSVPVFGRKWTNSGQKLMSPKYLCPRFNEIEIKFRPFSSKTGEKWTSLEWLKRKWLKYKARNYLIFLWDQKTALKILWFFYFRPIFVILRPTDGRSVPDQPLVARSGPEFLVNCSSPANPCRIPKPYPCHIVADRW